MRPIAFTVYGAPATKGSTVSFADKSGRIVTKTDSKGLGAWTQAVGWAAREAGVQRAARHQGVCIHATFVSKRPQKPLNAEFPVVRPDADKTTRALLDALTGVLYEDDAQVVDLTVAKRYGQSAETVVAVSVIE